MNTRFISVSKRLIVLTLSCIMLLGITPMIGKAYAETIHNDVVTEVKLTRRI